MTEKIQYEKELKAQLEKDAWLRHMLNKIGKPVTLVVVTGDKLSGILQAVQFVRGVINIEVDGGEDKVYYINWRNVAYMEVTGVEKKKEKQKVAMA